MDDFLGDVVTQLLSPQVGAAISAVNSGATPATDIATAIARLEPTLDRLGLLLNRSTGRALQPAISNRIFHYWHELVHIELIDGTPSRAHTEFLIGGALSRWAWRALKSLQIPVRQLPTPEFLHAITALVQTLPTQPGSEQTSANKRQIPTL